MNRSQRRRQENENTRYVKVVRALTADQKDVINSEAIRKAKIMIDNISKTINDGFFKAMRDNRVGEERANRILDRVKDFIDIEALRGI
ncbi:MAG: hypothetical protein WCR54_07080 [Clostridia bacterium]